MTRKTCWRAACLLLPATALALWLPPGTAPEAPAADHRDTPGLTANPTRDINDIYIFQSPTNAANTVMILTVNPFTGVLSPTTFDQRQFFDFKIDNNGDAIEDITFRFTFGAPDGSGIQDVTLRGLPAARFPPTGILARGRTGQNIAVQGGGTLRAANQDDPFFFDAPAFQNFLGANNNIPGDTGQQNAFRNPGVNFFGPNANTLAITLEIPSARLTRPGNPNIGLWSVTVLNNVQVDRMGRPAIVTALIRPLPGAAMGQPNRKDPFNLGLPVNDRRDFRAEMIGNLSNAATYNNAAQAAVLTDILLPDILTFNTTNAGGFLNGRNLRDDVIDAELGILTNGRVTTDNVPDDNGTRITDGNLGTTAAFPYIGAPNSPPAGPRNN